MRTIAGEEHDDRAHYTRTDQRDDLSAHRPGGSGHRQEDRERDRGDPRDRGRQYLRRQVAAQGSERGDEVSGRGPRSRGGDGGGGGGDGGGGGGTGRTGTETKTEVEKEVLKLLNQKRYEQAVSAFEQNPAEHGQLSAETYYRLMRGSNETRQGAKTLKIAHAMRANAGHLPDRYAFNQVYLTCGH